MQPGLMQQHETGNCLCGSSRGGKVTVLACAWHLARSHIRRRRVITCAGDHMGPVRIRRNSSFAVTITWECKYPLMRRSLSCASSAHGYHGPGVLAVLLLLVPQALALLLVTPWLCHPWDQNDPQPQPDAAVTFPWYLPNVSRSAAVPTPCGNQHCPALPQYHT